MHHICNYKIIPSYSLFATLLPVPSSNHPFNCFTNFGFIFDKYFSRDAELKKYVRQSFKIVTNGWSCFEVHSYVMQPHTPMDSLPTYFCCGEWKKPQNISSIYIFRSVHGILYHIGNIMAYIVWARYYGSYDMALKHDKYLKGRLLESEINQILTIIGRIALYLFWNIKFETLRYDFLVFEIYIFYFPILRLFSEIIKIIALTVFSIFMSIWMQVFIKWKEPKFETRVASIMTFVDIWLLTFWGI